MEELIEINARLEFEKKTSFTESANLEEELARAKFNASNNLSKSLGEQLKDSSNAKILRLEMENNRLTKQLAEMKENAALESAQRLMEVEKENARLSRKVESMQEVQLKENEQMILLEEEKEKLTSQKVGLEKTLDTVRENMERQLREFRVENEQLNLNLSSLRKRCEKTNDIKVGEMEKENVRLQDTVKEITTRLRDLEFEKKKRESNDNKIQELEEENERYEKECNDLHKKVAKYSFIEHKYEKLEVETADLEAENRKLNKIASNLRIRVEKGEEAEKQNIALSTENQRLNRCLESVKNTSMKAVDFEHEKEDLLREINKLKNLNNLSKEDRSKNEKLQVENMKLTAETRKLRKSVEIATSRLEEVLSERSDIERSFEDLKRKANRYEEIEKEIEKFETENADLLNCKADLENELRKLRLIVEQSQKNFEEERSKSVVVERELKQVKRIADRYLETNVKIQELESDNGELAQKCGVQSREITVLRQDLVNEKIGSQQLRNDLENMKRELNKYKAIGEYTQKAASDEEKFKSLEHLMQDAFKRSLELKDEKIRELDTRLAESKNRNIQIQETLRSVQRDHNVLLQRAEEDKLFSKSLSNDSKNHVKSRLGNEIIELKDHLIQLERANATLETENRSMQIHTNKLQEKNDNLEKIRNESQIEVRSCQGRLESLQRQNAQLQVDNRTFQSHLTSCQQQLNVAQKTKASISGELENALRQYEKLQEDCDKLQKLNDQLNAENDRFAKEFSNAKRAGEDEWKHRNDILQKEIERLQKSKAEQEDAIREAVDQVREADLEICKLGNKVDSLEQIVCKLEEENRGLMLQLQTILNQNQDLLTTVLESKQHMHDEQRHYLEKMNDLRRQKEKLEEKIMDQYKRYEPSPKRKTSFAANLVRRAKGMMTRTKSKEWGKASEIKEGEENSSFGSGSFGSGSFDESGVRRGGKKSTPSSMSKSKNFARSTTAINLVGNGHTSNIMRSAKSSENLFGDDMDSSWNTSNSKRKHVRDLSLMINSSDQTSISEDGPEEQITLSQFLNESNKSPKSRRKFLLEKKVDLTAPDTEADIKETDLANQGPRSATIMDDDEQKALRHQTRAKSEMNIPISQSPQARPHSVMGMPDQQPQTTQTLPRHYFRPKSAVPYESDQNGYQNRPKEREMRTDSYAPGSVRNLVKSYHEAANNRPEPPAPPPRRVRPIIGNPKSAFSRPDSGRKLPSTPTSAGSTPPKPDAKKKPGIWYEYGCV
ncbi:DgyrCDS2175 [Dimorphilus gyrociliatus]|uniref:DgyrCDS2175 n=1 Tax=Dimorphilus gyrociliatus TaxID=2664684 RepID=A0A7I8VCJ0_9ANNE|nr:DgyrCDS2175 [Dimorphilus gyrociliatus]